MGLKFPQEDNMCTEEEVKQINAHTDEVKNQVHQDYYTLAERVDRIEDRFTKDIHELFDHLRDIRKSIFTSQWTSVGITCSVLLALFGLLFNWLWSQDQLRSVQIAELSVMVGSAVATEQALISSVRNIETIMKEELLENGQEHEEDMEDHLKHYHEE